MSHPNLPVPLLRRVHPVVGAGIADPAEDNSLRAKPGMTSLRRAVTSAGTDQVCQGNSWPSARALLVVLFCRAQSRCSRS
jgi:hypothetical protein